MKKWIWEERARIVERTKERKDGACFIGWLLGYNHVNGRHYTARTPTFSSLYNKQVL
jgi:hypothetical protein